MIRPVSNILHEVQNRGLNLVLFNGKIFVTPKSSIDEGTRLLIRENRTNIIDELEKTPNPSDQPLVSFSWHDQQINVYRYNPEELSGLGGLICLDCETSIANSSDDQVLALVSASDGIRHFMIHPEDLVPFINSHKDRHIVFHNAEFDFRMIERYLTGKSQKACRLWLDMAGQGKFHDTMLLDVLLRIASKGGSGSTVPRSLDEVVLEYANLVVDKSCPFRTRYHEIIDMPWSEVDPGFFSYAAKDCIATINTYFAMHGKAVHLVSEHEKDFLPSVTSLYGPLTETLQTQASLALGKISCNGLTTDQNRLLNLKQTIHKEIDKLAKDIHAEYPGILKCNKTGDFILTSVVNHPSENQKLLRQQLERSHAEVISDERPLPRTEKGEVSLRAKDWQMFEADIDFVRIWFTYKKLCKHASFLKYFEPPVIHPKYQTIMITGRTACSQPNMQNIPRSEEFRQLIIPSKNHLLMTVDYNFIELVTLAATLRHRYGKSRLAELIQQGKDPHCNTAAMLLGKTLDEFMELKETDPRIYSLWRNRAKPINFGVPGGMRAKSLVAYAAENYGVVLSIVEAEEFRRKLIEEVYPELSQYVQDSAMDHLAKNLGVPVEMVWERLDFEGNRPGWLPHTIRKLVAGGVKADGQPFKKSFSDRVWDGLSKLNRNPKLDNFLKQREGSVPFSERLFSLNNANKAVTITGRIRAGASPTEICNTPFQGLAADGAKIALVNLVFKGFRVTGFAHDEFLIELLDLGGYASREQFEEALEIIRCSMSKVTNGVPVKCEATLSTCWSKKAKLIIEGDRVIPWKPEKS
jgi:DNA polymerase I-like protein with 3'-5' exonuclease and polymerase domains